MIIQFGTFLCINTFNQYTLPLAYSKNDYILVHGGGDGNSIGWTISHRIDKSTIQIGARGTSGWCYTRVFYLTIGFV